MNRSLLCVLYSPVDRKKKWNCDAFNKNGQLLLCSELQRWCGWGGGQAIPTLTRLIVQCVKQLESQMCQRLRLIIDTHGCWRCRRGTGVCRWKSWSWLSWKPRVPIMPWGGKGISKPWGCMAGTAEEGGRGRGKCQSLSHVQSADCSCQGSSVRGTWAAMENFQTLIL